LRCEGSRIVRCNASASGFDFVTDCGQVTACLQAISNCELASCTVDELGCASLPSRRIASLALGDEHTCALTVAGAVRCWGDNTFGQLGYGHTNDIGLNETAASAADVDVGGPVRQIVAGANHTCALLESGEARCWGQGNNGQLGLRNEANVGDDELPAAVPSIDLGGPSRALAAGGGNFTCALLLNGDVRCWGSGGMGQLGLGSIISAANRNIGDDETPASVGPIDLGAPVASLATGQNHSCVLSNTGDVRCWGRAAGGRLGYGNTQNIGDDETPASAGNVPLGASAVELSLGNAHSCAVLSGGAVRCWGSHLQSQLGYPDAAPVGANLGDDETPDTMPALDLGQPAVRIAAGGLHSCALLTDGAVRCWGGNSFGQLGNAKADVQIPLSGSVPRLELGGSAIVVAGGDLHACAVLATGELVCWGDMSNGKLGHGQGAGNARVGDDETPASVGVVPLF
jgi:alpha-tubulin suppressor-like RCC1 family protein